MKYLIIEQGSYSDYGVSIADITDCPLTREEMLKLLKINELDEPKISGEIIGKINFYDNSSISIKNFKEEAENNINGLFSCYSNRAKYKTVLDREYTKEELLKIAMANDYSGEDYWEEHIEEKYQQYLEGLELYQKLIKGRKTNKTKQ